jgi:hypothetical protein
LHKRSLLTKLRIKIVETRCGKLLLFLQDYAPACSSQKFNEISFKITDHPVYSPDLIIRYLKNVLKGSFGARSSCHLTELPAILLYQNFYFHIFQTKRPGGIEC